MRADQFRGARASGALLALALQVSWTVPSCAQAPEDFFRNTHHLTMLVGSGAGGGYDMIGRFVGRHLSRHLPGNPNFIFENIANASGIQAANALYNTAPKDGSVILAATNSSLALPIYKSPVAKFDPRKFEWIGSTGKQQAICVTSKSSGIATLDQARKREVPVSATAVTAGPGVFPAILNAMLGTKFKVIAGYSTGSMPLAVDRQEVDGLCGYAWQSYQANGTRWFSDDLVNILVQIGMTKTPDLPNVPLAKELVESQEDRDVLDMIVLPQEFGRPFVAPPGVPRPRMEVYRKAFKAMISDPEFLDDAKKHRIIIEAMDDQDIQKLLANAYSAPVKIHERASFYASQMN